LNIFRSEKLLTTFLGPNTTTFIVPGECFPTRYRSTSHGISAAAGKVGAIIAQVIIGPLATRGAPPHSTNTPWLNHVMEIFALFMFCGIFTSLLIPETKRKTLEQLAGEVPGTKEYDPELAGRKIIDDPIKSIDITENEVNDDGDQMA
jgi:PHS family inorganic phosphate transporter-like MFS transporter